MSKSFTRAPDGPYPAAIAADGANRTQNNKRKRDFDIVLLPNARGVPIAGLEVVPVVGIAHPNILQVAI